MVLYSTWYHHTRRWPSGAQVERSLLSAYYKTTFCALSWLITKITLRCTVSKTSKFDIVVSDYVPSPVSRF